MPRFYFDVSYGGRTEVDDDGVELVDAEQARAQALAFAPDMLKDHLYGTREVTVVVRDGHPEPLVTVTVSMVARHRDYEPR